jgi:hypothetical protein
LNALMPIPSLLFLVKFWAIRLAMLAGIWSVMFDMNQVRKKDIVLHKCSQGILLVLCSSAFSQ